LFYVVGDGIIAELGAVTLWRLLHVLAASGELTGQHATLKDVHDAVRVRRRISRLSRVAEVHREIDALSVNGGYTQ